MTILIMQHPGAWFIWLHSHVVDEVYLITAVGTAHCWLQIFWSRNEHSVFLISE